MFFNRSRKWIVKPSKLADDFTKPDPYLHRAHGDAYAEWLDAVTGKIDQAESHFGQSGPLTETVLLGVIAQRTPDTQLHWDAEKLEIKDRADLKPLIQRPYSQGWEFQV